MLGQPVVEIRGNARALLTAERTALNFLQLLSGVATKTASYVDVVKGTRAQIVDTRKTLPGLRLAQKYAVRTGGGTNHRIGLYDAVLIKENHIAAAGGVAAGAARGRRAWLPAPTSWRSRSRPWPSSRKRWPPARRWSCWTTWTCPRCARRCASRPAAAILEISGGVTLDGLRALAETGVDRISIGTLTKDVKATDYSMRFKDL